MDKALHQFDMPNEYKYIQIQSNTYWFGLNSLIIVSSDPTCHPDPTADEPVPSILTPSWHSFRGFGPPDLGAEHHVAANAASCTHGSL